MIKLIFCCIFALPKAFSKKTEYVNYLVIEGNIGAGKTSLANMLAEEMKARLILEKFAENPFLPKFYSNPDKYSFPLELSFSGRKV